MGKPSAKTVEPVEVIDLWKSTREIINSKPEEVFTMSAVKLRREESEFTVYSNNKSLISKVGGDSSSFPEYDYTSIVTSQSMILGHQPIERVLPVSELWSAAVRTPKGRFITGVATFDAFRNGWKFVKTKDEKTEVDAGVKAKLNNLNRRYRIREIHQLAVFVARALGKCLVVKLNKNERVDRRNRADVKLRVVPINEYMIDYDEWGDPIAFHPFIALGHSMAHMTIQAKDAVFYVNVEDPFGNGYQGIPETFSMYNQLKWMTNIQRGWAEAMSERGTSLTHFKIKDFDLDDRAQWEQAYGDPTTYTVVFTDDETELTTFQGVSSSFDLNRTSEAFTKDCASASGIAMGRIDGTQGAQGKGAEEDTDNYYSILNSIQENYEKYLIELYEMLDPSLIDNFEITWEIERELDRLQTAQLDAILVTNANMSLDYKSYNDIRQSLGLTKVPGGDDIASIYIAKNIEPIKMKQQLKLMQAEADIKADTESTESRPPNEDEKEKTGLKQEDRNVDQNIKKAGKQAQKKAGKDSICPIDFDDISEKEKLAMALLLARDSDGNNINSLRDVSDKLREKFNESMSPNRLVEIRNFFEVKK